MHLAHAGGRVAVHSARHPIREAEAAVAGALDGRPSDLLVVIGLGAGFILDALEARGWRGRVLALEPEPDLISVLRGRRDLRSWTEADRLRILAAPEFAGADDCWRWFDETGEEPPVIVNPVLARVRPEATQAARGLVTRLRFNAESNAQARRQFGGRYLLNTLRNLQAIADEGDVLSLTGAAPHVPAVVVAAGPSLDENIEWLREVARRAVVIAVDTALRPLLAAGIHPHLAVAVDPGETNARHLTELPACPDTYLVAEASVAPSAVAAFQGRTFLFSVSNHEPWPWLRANGAGRGRLRAWGSVLTSAFDLALEMGCTPIAFAGADLAFTGHRPYARGVAYEEDWRRLREWGVPLEEQWRQQVEGWPRTEEPGIDGAPARTAPHLVAFRDWLVEQTRLQPKRRFVNLTGAGILHGGRIEAMSAAQFASGIGGTLPADLIRRRYSPGPGERVLQAAACLAETGEPVDTWVRFAEGLTPERILRAASLAPSVSHVPRLSPVPPASPHFDAEWIAPLAASLPLVPMAIPPARMERFTETVRLFRCRTTAARLIGCVLRLPDGAVLEDGCSMRRRDIAELDAIEPGEYVLWRDEVYIRASDGTDPRDNGRAYALLVPETVACLEQLPLHTVLETHL